MQLPKSELRREWSAIQKKEYRRMFVSLLLLIGVILFCQCFRYNLADHAHWFAPGEMLQDLIHFTPGAAARLKITMVSLAAGAGLCIAGAIFQTAYRNPLASPNIIGATAGVNLGNVLVVLLCSVQAYDNIFLRYRYCYGFTVLCMGITLFLGWIAGDRRKNSSVLEMVMAGSVVSQLCRVFSMYIMYAKLDEEDRLLYQEIQMGMQLDRSWKSMLIFFCVMGATVLPVLFMSYRLNVLGLERTETLALGINARPFRLIAQICGGAMVTCAMIHCGEIGMISMVIPYLVRQAVGADFRKVAGYSALSGGILLMCCRLVTSFTDMSSLPIPVTFLVSVVLMPVFLVALIIFARRGF